MTTTNEAAEVVEVRITIAARPGTVFRFLSDPVAFEQWMGAGSSIGGAGEAVRVAYPNGDVAAGVVREITPNERIVMSWGYESGAHGIAAGSTQVEIALTPVAGGTRVVLRHSGLREAAQRFQHRAGWRHYLAVLSQTASPGDDVAERAIDAYTAAWTAWDATERAQLLQGCWSAEGVFRDVMGYVEGIGDLNDYIGFAQLSAPGWKLARSGPISRAHGFASYRWQMMSPDGSVVMTGSNTAALTPEGLIHSMTGFWDKP
jgi:uncharacterized protein YndB with AHSA1/START domain